MPLSSESAMQVMIWDGAISRPRKNRRSKNSRRPLLKSRGRRLMRSPPAVSRTSSTPFCAATGKRISGNWRPIWRERTLDLRFWNRCSRIWIGDTARAASDTNCRFCRDRRPSHEIESSTTRISELVRAIKEYTFMDQAPVQNVDVVKSLETTLMILNHKLKRGVTVQRDYPDPRCW